MFTWEKKIKVICAYFKWHMPILEKMCRAEQNICHFWDRNRLDRNKSQLNSQKIYGVLFWRSLHFRNWHSFGYWSLGSFLSNSGRSTEPKYSDIISSSPKTIKSIRAIRRKKFSIEKFIASTFSISAFGCWWEIIGSWKFVFICFWYVLEMSFISEIGFYSNHWIIGLFNT